MIQSLGKLGRGFEKEGSGEYDMRKVRHMATSVLPMQEGRNLKKVLDRQLRRLRVSVTNRFRATRQLKGPDDRRRAVARADLDESGSSRSGITRRGIVAKRL